jgi:hypothetical protein
VGPGLAGAGVVVTGAVAHPESSAAEMQRAENRRVMCSFRIEKEVREEARGMPVPSLAPLSRRKLASGSFVHT